jgi:hypothetical protein
MANHEAQRRILPGCAFAETERAVDFLDVNAPVLYRLNGAGVL